MVKPITADVVETGHTAAESLIPNGYKKTAVGVIPEAWSVLELHEACERIAVGLATSVTKHYRPAGVPIVRNLNIKEGFFDGHDMLFISEEFAKANASKAARALDVLTVHTGANLGDTCVLPDTFDNCQTFTTLITTPKRNLLDPHFLCLHMSSFFGKREMNRLQVGGGKGNLNTADLKQYRIVVPPLHEQETIAQALSDADALIESLEQLIAKKRQIKQGAMQELLTGKKRLPGFCGDWPPKKIGELLCYERPEKYIVTTTDYEENAPIPVVTANKSFVLGFTNEEFGVYRNLPAIVFDDFTTDSKYVDFPFKVKSSAIKILKSRDVETSLKFVQGRLGLINFPAGEHKRYYISEYQHIECGVPLPGEQAAIAAVSTDMDAEIAALEDKLAKARMIKQGMMQELLTGRIRLV